MKLYDESKAITTSIKFSSRASIKINDNFFTFEACEERQIPDIEDIDLDTERELLWDTVNDEVDKQVDETVEMMMNKK